MRYRATEHPTILGKFTTGDTVTITLYDLSDESAETLTSNACNELGSTGVFYWSTSNITNQPAVFTEYCWVMTNGTTSQYGKIAIGGYPEEITSDIGSIEGTITTIQGDIASIEADISASAADIALLKKYELNRWKIENNQFIVYADDGVTPLLTFNLKNENGEATNSNPFERVPA